MAKKKRKGVEDRLLRKRESVWNTASKKTEDRIFQFSDGYKAFMGKAKTERRTIEVIKDIASAAGFKGIDECQRLGYGDRLIFINKSKGALLITIGKEGLEKGCNILTSHIDCPRLDLKQNPLYEEAETELAMLKTHYYGGIKKYHWVNIPLALYGKVVRADGTHIDICIGEEEAEGAFIITDLLPHLAKSQYERKLSEAIKGEELNILIGSMPMKGKKENKVKLNVLNMLNKKYGLVEEDFVSAELEAVPAAKPRDIGLDRSMLAAYGHDDKVCAYASLKAICDTKAQRKTSIAIFCDKEEVGSEGNTSAKSRFLELCLASILSKMNVTDIDHTMRTCLASSKALSGDVDAGLDPTFKEVHEVHNAAKLGHGVVICKYGGAGGKYQTSDANAEYVGEIRKLLNKNRIPWQTGELGKVDEGGGGTIAKFLAEYGMEIIDCGPPVLSMHAPFEIVSKADVYQTYRAYRMFLEH